MAVYLAGLIVFFGAHVFTAMFRGQRAKIVSRTGQSAYRGIYSLFALTGLVLIILGWRDASTHILYIPPAFLRHIAYLLMIFAFILVVAAYAPAGKIAHLAKHPMLAGIKIWAFSHLLVNGDVRSVLLFGAFLTFAVGDRIALKKRDAPIREAGPLRNDLIAIAIGLAAYGAVFFHLHRYIAGVSLY